MNNVSALLHAIDSGKAQFKDVIDFIDDHYHYTPTRFNNGSASNQAGTNVNSCKVFYFAKLNGLNAYDTLSLFVEHYSAVLANPLGNDHQNIRQFKYHAWSAIIFYGEVLKAKTPEEVAKAVAKRLILRAEAEKVAAELAAKEAIAASAEASVSAQPVS